MFAMFLLLTGQHPEFTSASARVAHAPRVRRSSPTLGRTKHPLETSVTDSKQIAGLLGPTMVAMLVSEFPLIQAHLYDAQIPPVVYLSGVAMFVAGLAVVRTVNLWTRNWAVLVTLSGWFFLALGLLRMFAADQYQREAAETSPVLFIVLEGCLLVVALAITYKAYARCTLARLSSPPVRPHSSVERTRTDRPLQALISLWALRVPPVRAAYLAS